MGCCAASDSIHKDYFDNSIYSPFCFNCVCLYDVCKKPCCGGVVKTVLVPNDHKCYPCATRCCNLCCVSSAIGFVKDSQDVQPVLIEALRKNEARVKAMKGVKTYSQGPHQTAELPNNKPELGEIS